MEEVVPWIDESEFLAIYEEIFSDDDQLISHGRDRLAVWKSRVSSERDLPPFVVCTLELLSVKLCQPAAVLDYRLGSSMALIRFVNLLTEYLDKTENKERSYGLSHDVDGERRHKLFTLREKHQTLRMFAERLGLPQWLVDMRHSATHSKHLPSVEQLQRAVSFALSFVQETCWRPQLRCRVLPEFDDCVDHSVCECLQQYVYDAVDNCQKPSEYVALLKIMSRTHSGHIISALASNAGLICTADVLNAFAIDTPELVGSVDLLELPDVLVSAWQPILYLINNMRLTRHLLYALADQLTDSSDVDNRLRAGWIDTILSAIQRSTDEMTAAGKLHYIRPCRVIGRYLLRRVTRVPNIYTSALVSKVSKFCVPALSPSAHDALLQLIDCYVTSTSPAAAQPSDEDVHDLTQLHGATVSLSSHVEHDDCRVTDIWTRATGSAMDWAQTPIGSFCGQNVDLRSLELLCVDLNSPVTSDDDDATCETQSPRCVDDDISCQQQQSHSHTELLVSDVDVCVYRLLDVDRT